MKAVVRVERAGPDEMPVRSVHRGKAAGVGARRRRRPVQVEVRPAPVENHREMMPLIESKHPRLADDIALFRRRRSRLCLVRRNRAERSISSASPGIASAGALGKRRGLQFQIHGARLIAHFHPLRRVEFKHMFIFFERLPFHPAFEGRGVQASEGLRRQLQIVAVAAQRQDPDLRRRNQRCCSGGNRLGLLRVERGREEGKYGGERRKNVAGVQTGLLFRLFEDETASIYPVLTVDTTRSNETRKEVE